jgi:hypothetical protein
MAEALTAFTRTVLTCDDLLFDDALSIAETVRKTFEELGSAETIVRGGPVGAGVPKLSELDPFAD